MKNIGKRDLVMTRRHIRLTTFQIIFLAFFLLVLLGTLFLMMPIATRDGHGASFSDAIFTATSASCVTGLVVQDTATYWSLFGQLVILFLIQIGGMGVITISVAIALLFHKKISLLQRSVMQESVSETQIGGIVRFTSLIIKTVLIVELLGAVLLFTVFGREYGILKGIYYSVFHSISAFCNAGFDLMGEKQQFSSLVSYVGSPIINITVVLLILSGGLGFKTWEDIKVHGIHIKKYRLQSKLILVTGLILVVVPFIYFFFAEFSTYPVKERVLSSLFQTVTPRTAGFNTVDMNQLSDSGIMITILLMMIGGATGSTAGGIKTTTVAVLLIAAVAVFRQRKDATAFGRRIANEAILNAVAIFVLYNSLFLVSSIIISKMENLPMLTCMFESSSAIATVGLTLGITGSLNMISRAILIFLMFFGRVGGLTIFFVAFSNSRVDSARLPKEDVNVG